MARRRSMGSATHRSNLSHGLTNMRHHLRNARKGLAKGSCVGALHDMRGAERAYGEALGSLPYLPSRRPGHIPTKSARTALDKAWFRFTEVCEVPSVAPRLLRRK